MVAAAGCAGSSASTGAKGYVSGDGTVTVIPPQDREPAPDIHGESVRGKSVGLQDARGHVTVVNVWASWCAPCRAEAPELVAAAKQLGDVEFLGINTRDDRATAKAFIRSHDIPYPSLYDPNGRVVLAFYDTINVKSLPFTMVLDTKGRIGAVVAGKVTTTTLTDLAHQFAGEG